jgi:hypothetical protein
LIPAFSQEVIHLSFAREPSPEAMELPVEVYRMRDTDVHTINASSAAFYKFSHDVINIEQHLD